MKHKAQVAGSLVFVVAVLLAAWLPACNSGAARTTRTLFVGDYRNHRVLIYDTPFTTGEAATVVLGQADLTHNAAPIPPTASSMDFPTDVVLDAAGDAAVADSGNDRVLGYKHPFTNGMAAGLVLGQADFVSRVCATTQTGLCDPEALAVDSSGNLWVGDSGNNRVLEFKTPFTNNMSASVVIGQPDFVTGTVGLSATKMGFPEGLAFDKTGNLWVADDDNSRVLEFKPPFTNGMAASLEVGQVDLNTGTCLTSATGMCFTVGVAFDKSGNLWVGDDGNCRALEFVPPFTTGMAASLVLGQAKLTDSCVAATPTQAGLTDAFGVGFDSAGNLFVADSGDNRTMVFSPPFTTGMAAKFVIGQADFTSALRPSPPTATSQAFPIGLRTAP